MKHLLNLIILCFLIVSAFGIAYLTRTTTDPRSAWPVAYLPWTVLSILYGFKIDKDYKYEK